jgi:putative ATPase
MTDDLFDHAMQERMKHEAPLAARMRPRTLDEYIGQEHIVGEGKLLRRAIEADRLFSSIILWGPPGTGKTTLAQVIANTTKSHFVTISAILAGKADLRVIIEEALERRRLHNLRTILFVDEVHRWNKAQQDALLPHVENGSVTLIGATTENPYFEVIKALISRSRVFQLRNLNQEETGILIDRAISDKERGYGNKRIELDADARSHLIDVSSGDARNALNAIELAVESTPPDKKGIIHITLDVAQESIQRRAVLYDKDGDAHYDTISAFIKSVRGSDPDAALYWLGLPEGIYPIVEATLYLATAPKSNSAGAYFKAMKKIEQEGQVSVPRHLMDGNRDAAAMGHGKDYVYPHEHEGHFIPQQYLPKRLLGTYFYGPSQEGYESQVTARLEMWREAQRKALGITKVDHIPAMSEEQIIEMKRKIK